MFNTTATIASTEITSQMFGLAFTEGSGGGTILGEAAFGALLRTGTATMGGA